MAVGALQLLAGLLVLVLKLLGLGTEGLHLLPLDEDLVAQRHRVFAQTLVGTRQFLLPLFQQPFRGQPAAPFLCQHMLQGRRRILLHLVVGHGRPRTVPRTVRGQS